MQCFRYLHKGHPASHWKKNSNNKSGKKGDDFKYKSSNLSKSTKTSKEGSITKPRKSRIKIKGIYNLDKKRWRRNSLT